MDDVHQGAGVSKLFEVEGIKAVVSDMADRRPMVRVWSMNSSPELNLEATWLRKAYHTTPLLYAITRVSVAALADQVQEQVDEYGSDRVAGVYDIV